MKTRTDGTREASLCLFFPSAHSQIGLDKRLQIAIQHAIHVTDLQFRAMVFDEAIGLQHVGANLGSKIDIKFGVLDLPL